MQSPWDPVNHLLPGPLVLEARSTGGLHTIALGVSEGKPGPARGLLGSPGGEQVYANEAIREEFERGREPRE